MKILFIHQNFPGQFKHLAPALAARGHEVVALTLRVLREPVWQGVKIVRYQVRGGSTPNIHPWLVDFETKTLRGQACFHAARELQAQGFTPDVIVAHPGWGESLFLKEVWPAAKLGIYCEFFYQPHGSDVDFDPEFAQHDPALGARMRLKNLNNLLHFDIADAGLAPTAWQASTYPEPFRSRISVIHDGIDTALLAPRPDVQLTLGPAGGERVLSRRDEVITFVNRNIEPYRGAHTFLRALPDLLARRPNARVLIVGGEGVSYGAPPADGRSWRAVLTEEVRPAIPDADWARVHFLGQVPYAQFIALLQLSSVHVYLTYPFVLSWSLLEAMSTGCAIVASRTAPLEGVITHDETGRLVDFFNPAALSEAVCALLDDAPARARLGAAARAFAQAEFDLKTRCLPGQVAWVESLA